MTPKLTEQAIKHLLKIQGEARGITFKTDAGFILKEKGRAGLEKVKERLDKLGCPIDYEKIESMAYYPIGLRIISLLVIKEIFGFSGTEIEKMGQEAPKISLIIKLFGKFFFSIEESLKQAPKIWEKHYTIGRLEMDADLKSKKGVARLFDFNVHPILCDYIKGYLATIMQMVLSRPVKIEETKCYFDGDKFHEYLAVW